MGSVTTLLLSLLRTILEAEPMSTIFLLYGSRDEDNIIFRDELECLSECYAGQLHVEHILSRPKRGSGGLFGLFKKSSTNWRQDRPHRRHRSHGVLRRAYAARAGVRLPLLHVQPWRHGRVGQASAAGRGMEEKQTYAEHFLNAYYVPGEIVPGDAVDSGKRVVAHLKWQRIELLVPDVATILDVLVKIKHDPPYSCTAEHALPAWPN